MSHIYTVIDIYVTLLYYGVTYMYLTLMSMRHDVTHAYGVQLIHVRTLFLITLCQGYMIAIIYALVVRPTYIPIHV
jgi:hypothetical protein